MPYLSTSEVMIHEEALIYISSVPLPVEPNKWPRRWLVPSPVAMWPNAFVESRSLQRGCKAAFVDF